MAQLVIVRHGQSQWNSENRFTGEVDVPLTDLGRQEAKQAGQKLKGFEFTQCFTSALHRAQETLHIILQEMGKRGLPITENKALNERNYGSLQGLNKAETAKKYGEEQVVIWRRSFDVPPPDGESLKDTAARVIPYYESTIEPLLKKGQNILLVAHGNSLRSLMMHLENIGSHEIVEVNIPTGVPRLYQFNASFHLEDVRYL